MVGLCLLFSLVSYTGRGQFCAAIIVSCWIIWSWFITLTGVYEPWVLGVLLDAICAAVLLWPTSSKARAWLALTYCLQIAAHVSYGLTDDPDPMVYYWSVGLIGWAQIVMVAGWSSGRWVLHIWDRLALLARQAGLGRSLDRGGVNAS